MPGISAQQRPAIRQVFISSTSADLQKERKAVLRNKTKFEGLVFVGMEDFGSRPETPVEISLEKVRTSDVYVGIFAQRYGFVPEEGENRSITDLEYLEAVRCNLPRLIYLKKWPAAASVPAAQPGDEGEDYQVRRAAELRRRLERDNTCTYFSTPASLAAQLAIDLYNLRDQSVGAPRDGVDQVVGSASRDLDAITHETRLTSLLTFALTNEQLKQLWHRLPATLGTPFPASNDQAARRLAAALWQTPLGKAKGSLNAFRSDIDWAIVLPKRSVVPYAAVFALMVVASASFVARNYIYYWQDWFRSPPHAREKWTEEFLAGTSGDTHVWKNSLTRWSYPKGAWEIVPGLGKASVVHNLKVSGIEAGVPKTGPGKLYDFDARFMLAMYPINGHGRAMWAMRLQQDGKSGYVFQLDGAGQVNQVQFTAFDAHSGQRNFLSCNNCSLIAPSGELQDVVIPLSYPCCDENDFFVLDAKARGNRFRIHISRQNIPKTYFDEVDLPTAIDQRRSWRSGDFGFLESENFAMRVVYLCLVPQPVSRFEFGWSAESSSCAEF